MTLKTKYVVLFTKVGYNDLLLSEITCSGKVHALI